MSENDSVLDLTESTFDAAVADGMTLVDFWAPWCGPCRMMGPVLDELAGHFGDTLRIAKINVDDSPHLATRFRVQGIPLLVIFATARKWTDWWACSHEMRSSRRWRCRQAYNPGDGRRDGRGALRGR